jgi:DNA-binding response OmpR family regulator
MVQTLISSRSSVYDQTYMSDSATEPTILVVDDEPEVADAYSLRLQQEYDVRTAYGGEAAMEEIDDGVRVVLLDRRMPDMSGDEVLEAIREEGYESRVIMVTAVTPDYDILDMPFDDYLCKPVEREDLFDAIEQQAQAVDYHDTVSEYFGITAKQSLLEQRKSPVELEDHEEYQRLSERAEELKAEMDDQLDEFDDMAMAFNDINRA